MPPDSHQPDDAPRPGDANVVDPAVLAERRAQRAELAEQVAARRAADAQALAAELSAERARLEAELERARKEPERLSLLVAERERALRTAQQRAHGEEAQRIETTEELAARERRHAAELAELAARAERAEAAASAQREELAARVERAEAAASAQREELAARAERAETAADAQREELAARAERAEAAASAQREELAARVERAETAADAQREELTERIERAEADATRQAKELEKLRTRLTEAEQITAAAESARRRAEGKRAASREKRRRAIEAREAAEAELADARAEARATREGADAVMAEAAHEQAERDTLRAALEQARAERDALRTELDHARVAREARDAELQREQAEREARDAERQRALAARDAERERERVARDAALEEQRMAREAELEREREAAVGGVPVAIALPRLQAEFAVARSARGRVSGSLQGPEGSRAPMPALARERRLVADRAVVAGISRGTSAERQVDGANATPDVPGLAASAVASPRWPRVSERRVPPRAIPVTALALERERSSRLQLQLDRLTETERELRGQVATLEAAVASRMDAEQRIEGALRRVRGELEAAHALRMLTERGSSTRSLTPTDPARGTAPVTPDAGPSGLGAATPPAAASPPTADDDTPSADADAPPAPDLPPAMPGFDAGRLNAARERLRATAAEADAETAPVPAAPLRLDTVSPLAQARPGTAVTLAPVWAPAPVGPPVAWLPAALRRLAREDAETAGRILVGVLPAQGLVTHSRVLSYDVVLSDRGTVAVAVNEGHTVVRALEGPRDLKQIDFRVSTTHAGFARLLLGRRGLRRRARVRGHRRKLRELRRLAREPLALRDLASTGATLEPALALWLAALAIAPTATSGHCFTIAHAPLPGGAPDAWLRIQPGVAPTVLRTRPGEAPAVTLRCTRGALLALLAGVPLPAGEGAAIDGEMAALNLVRGWIRATEFRSP